MNTPMISKGYTLWLMPKGRYYHRFADLIKRLAKEYGGPIFQPHVTLLGELSHLDKDVKKLTEKLVTGQKPFSITLRQIDYQEYHFRALFVKVDVTKPLVGLHEKAKELFGMQHIPPYMPHLSLLYGNYQPKLKEEIISTIGREQPAEFEVNSIHLIRGGQVENWQIVNEFIFKSV